MQEIIYKDSFIAIVKDTWNKGSLLQSDNIIVGQGMTRFWLYNSNLSEIYCHNFWEKEYGYKSISNPSEGIIRVEFTDGQWYYLNLQGRLLIDTAFTEASDFRDGHAYVRVGPYDGECIIDHDGNLYIKNSNNGILPIPSGYVGGFTLDKNHLAFYKNGEYYLFDKDINPINELYHIKFKTFENGLADWYIILDSNTILYLDNNSTDYKDPKETTYSLISEECLHISRCGNERDYHSLYFKNGNKISWFGEVEDIDTKELILIKRLEYDFGDNVFDDFDDSYKLHGGCVNYSGEYVIPIAYSSITFSQNYIHVEMDNKEYTYNLNGNLLYNGRELPKGIHAYEELDNALLVKTFADTWKEQILYGIINAATFETILPIEYSIIYHTQDNTFIVSKDNRYGLLDHDLNFIIPCRRLYLLALNNGSYICQFENKEYAIITEYEDYIIPETFYRIEKLDGNRLSFYLKELQYVRTDFSLNTVSLNEMGEEIKLKGFWKLKGDFYKGHCVFKYDNGKMGIVNCNSEIITGREYESIDVIDIQGIFIGTYNDSKYFLNPSRKIEKKFVFSSIYNTDEVGFVKREDDLIYVSDGSNTGVINYDCDIIIDCIYSNIIIWDDYIALYRGNLIGKADLDGNIIIPCEFKSYEQLENGYYIAENEFACIISPHGQIIVPSSESYRRILQTEGECLMTVKISPNGEYLYGLLSPKGKLWRKAELSHIGKFSDGEALANFGGKKTIKYNSHTHKKQLELEGGKWGVISDHGKWLIQPNYESIGKLSNGYRQVSIKQGNKSLYGIVSRNGKVVVNTEYEYVRNVVDGMIVYAIGGTWSSKGFEKERLNLQNSDPNKFLYNARWGIMDISGNKIVAPFANYIHNISENKVSYRIGNQYGILDLSTRTKFMTDYNYISSFREGICIVGKIDADNKFKYGYMKEDLSEIVGCEYDKAFLFKDGEGYLEKNGVEYSVNTNGELTRLDDEDDYTYYNSDDDTNWEEEAWYFLTGGQYGDYPGGNVDYDFLGL